jgi:membrane protein required for beta-lactamase induction
MKYLSSQFGLLFAAGETRANLKALLRYFAFLIVMIAAYAVLFHLIMIRVEGQQHSWITGFYWTLVVMTTLGFGDITFTTDVGRLASSMRRGWRRACGYGLARSTRERRHVIVTGYDAVARDSDERHAANAR